MRSPLDDAFGEGTTNKVLYFASGVPYVGDVVDMVVGYVQLKDYFKNTGLGWSDIEYPGVGLAGARGIGGIVNYVSSNIEDLYDDAVSIYRGEDGRFTRKKP